MFPITWAKDLELDDGSQWLVSGMIPRSGVTLLFADRNVGKSFFAYALAGAVARGEPFFDRQVEQGSVLLCALEGQSGVRQRLIGIREQQPGVELPIAVSEEVFHLTSKEAVEDLVSTALHCDLLCPSLRLIIIDTLSMALGSDDENGDGMRCVVTAMNEVSQRCDAAVLVLHHPGHGDKSRARGHSSLEAGCNAVFSIRTNAKGDIRNVECTKMRDGDRPETMSFTLEDIHFPPGTNGMERKTAVVRPLASHVRSKADGVTTKVWLRMFLKDGEWHLSSEVVEAGLKLGFADRSIRRYASEMCEVHREPRNELGHPGLTTWRLLPAENTAASGVGIRGGAEA